MNLTNHPDSGMDCEFSTEKKKIALRETLIQQRRLLPELIQIEKTSKLCTILEKQSVFLKSQHIAFYWPHLNEISPLPLLETALSLKKQCYLPVLKQNDLTLAFYAYSPTSTLMKNKFNIPEPQDPSKQIRATELDLVLIPTVAFTKRGDRLGMGAAYYDRTFEFLKKNSAAKPRLCALAYGFQELAEIPQDPWDLQLHYVATENEIVRI